MLALFKKGDWVQRREDVMSQDSPYRFGQVTLCYQGWSSPGAGGEPNVRMHYPHLYRVQWHNGEREGGFLPTGLAPLDFSSWGYVFYTVESCNKKRKGALPVRLYTDVWAASPAHAVQLVNERLGCLDALGSFERTAYRTPDQLHPLKGCKTKFNNRAELLEEFANISGGK